MPPEPRRRQPLIDSPVGQALLMLVLAVGIPAAIGSAVADRRGWLVGAICAAIYAVVFALGSWPWFRGWSRRHPLADGAFLGPLAFVLPCLVRAIPLWVCVIVGVVATGLGVLRGAQRRRRWERLEAAEAALPEAGLRRRP